MTKDKPTVLVFASSGYLGSHTFEHLAAKIGHRANIISLNPGMKWRDRWNIGDRIAKLVQHNFEYNRDHQRLCDFKELLDYDLGNVKMIVDLATFRDDQMKDMLDFIKLKFKDQPKPFYFYISTDGVYEVSKRPQGPWKNLKEEDAVRPADPEERKRFAKWDAYAEGKMTAEERVGREIDDISFLSLRPSDAMGPRDSWDDSWWRYQTWLTLATAAPDVISPVKVPTWVFAKPCSVIYGPDIARFISELTETVLNTEDYSTLSFRNMFYNFGHPQPVQLQPVIEQTQRLLGFEPQPNVLQGVEMPEYKNGQAVDTDLFLTANPHFNFAFRLFYPGITCPSPVSMERFRKHFPAFKFTSFEDGEQQTIDFFDNVSKSEATRPHFENLLRNLYRDFINAGLMRPGEKALNGFVEAVHLRFGFIPNMNN